MRKIHTASSYLPHETGRAPRSGAGVGERASLYGGGEGRVGLGAAARRELRAQPGGAAGRGRRDSQKHDLKALARGIDQDREHESASVSRAFPYSVYGALKAR